MIDITNTNYYKYAEDILSGKRVACEYVKLAAKRFFDFLSNPDYEFKYEKVQRVIKFIGLLKHFTGEFARKPFILTDWQEFVMANIFGFYYKGTDNRVTKNVYLEMARKQGKTALAAAISLYCLIADNEPNAEVELIANSSKQAGICFSMCKNFSESIDTGTVKYFKKYRDSLRFNPNKGLLQVLSSDSGVADGYNSYCYIVDEYHAASTSEMFDVMKSSQGMRRNPLAIIITTAGFNLGGPCFQQRQTNIEILKGLKKDPTQFTLIYTLDEDDDWKDENVWYKCSPNLGITVKLDYYREQVQQAENNPSLEVGIKTKNFNLWLQTSKVWISDKYITDSMQELSYEDLTKHGSYCYQGIDLAAVGDLTVLSTLVYDENEKVYYFKTEFFVPQTALEEGTNNFIYTQWYKQGYLNVTPGNVTDYEYISKKQLEINKIIPVYQCAYDTWNSTQYVVDATSYGLNMVPFSQTLGSFNRSTKEFERLIKSEKIVIDSNPITRWCFLNVALKTDYYDNCKPVKGSSPENKIDAAIAMLEALGLKLYQDQPDVSITFQQ